jgi:hypothetical protein
MGIQLDWQVESEKSVKQRAKEDPAARRRRFMNLLRLIVSLLVLLSVIAGVVYVVSQRLNEVEQTLESVLSDTVQAEVAALRIGDQRAFMDLQRSATDDWYQQQEATFEDYQRLLRNTDIQLTGVTRDVVIDGQRGRVQIEEIINGVPFVRTWFYWDYEPVYEVNAEGEETLAEDGGWRHVPPDYEFWGAQRLDESERLRLRYRAVDDLFAEQLRTGLNAWLDDACGFLLDCAGLPRVTVDVIAAPLERPFWHNDNPWQMIVPSPYMGQARADMPFDTEMQVKVAELLAQRLIDEAMSADNVVYPRDAYYLRSAAISWLVGRFVQLETNTFLMTSIVRHYGEAALARLLDAMQADSDMAIISSVLNEPNLATTNLDWRDLLTWRLVTENDLIQRDDRVGLLTLYDTRDADVMSSANRRYDQIILQENPLVLLTEPAQSDDGAPQLRATVQTGRDGFFRQDIVTFNLVDNVWRRAS